MFSLDSFGKDFDILKSLDFIDNKCFSASTKTRDLVTPGDTQPSGTLTNQRPASALCDQSEARIQGRESRGAWGGWFMNNRSALFTLMIHSHPWYQHLVPSNTWDSQKILPNITFNSSPRPASSVTRYIWGVLIKLQLIRLSVSKSFVNISAIISSLLSNNNIHQGTIKSLEASKWVHIEFHLTDSV